MSLPILNAPSYNLTVPSTKKKIKYRPFLVKEEKLLLMAKESKDIKDIVETIRTIVDNCTFNILDIDNLATFDIEYIFLQIRGQSVGKSIEINLICKAKCALKIRRPASTAQNLQSGEQQKQYKED